MFIFWLSSQTGNELKAAGLGDDSIHIAGHFWMYFLLSFAFYRATKSVPLAIVLCVAYAFTDEYHQSFVPGRAASWSDITNDTFASIIAGGIVWKFYQHLPAILKNLLKA